jgi:hypothetical protein
LSCFLGSIKFCICKQYLKHSTSNCNHSLKECLLRHNHLTFWWKYRFSLLTTSRACHSKLWPMDACHALYTQCNHHNINGSLCKCTYARICIFPNKGYPLEQERCPLSSNGSQNLGNKCCTFLSRKQSKLLFKSWMYFFLF